MFFLSRGGSAVETHRSVLGLFAVVLVIVGGLSASPTSARVALPGNDFRECGPTPGIIDEHPPSYPYVKGPVGCKLADKIARRYAVKVLASDYEIWAHEIEGFRCRLLGYYGDGTVARCGGSNHRAIKIVSGG
jgi:hypothetical protein